MQNVKKLIKKKSFLPSRGMSDIRINELIEKCTLTSTISASSEAVIHKYGDIQDLIVTAVTARGLLSQYEPITFMEDFISVASFIVKNKTYEYFAVYDGHGGRDSKTGIKKGGEQVAEDCVRYIPEIIKNTLKNNDDDIKDLLIKSFEKADKDHFLKDKKKFPENVGSTAIIMLRENKNIYIANLGDSRAVICKNGKVYFETDDCDWTNPSEQERIGINKNNKTYVIKTNFGIKKFILNGRFLNGEKWNIAASRSFGDYHFKLGSDKPPVTAKPDVRSLVIDEDMKLILIASDGIWENEKGLKSEHYISKFLQIAKKQDSPNADECLKETCKEFVRWCMIAQLKFEYRNYGDNIALIAIGILNGKSKEEWFRDIKNWKGIYEDNNLISKDIDDAIQEEDSEEIDYGSDSESCKIDFTQL
ncbi:phosphatase 2C-like domain-containing protein [Rhizophagus diaphanus]|nr:phosphatase 2C-like domain-containing protein [Rhizophagus diaphanus] [Rhizophagus sp. MUCL 43196]